MSFAAPNFETQKDLFRALGACPLPVPKTTRELFQSLALYETDAGISALVDRMNLAGVTPHQIYRAVHDRNPGSHELSTLSRYYDPGSHLLEALRSSEFQRNVFVNLLRAYPEKGRDVFIHVPKCAGTDLIFNIAHRGTSVLLPKMIDDEGWISKNELFEALRTLVLSIPHFDKFFAYGHIPLNYYIEMVGIRDTDKIFSVIRDPVDILLSHANYAITRLRQDPFGSAPDTRETLSLFGMERLPERVSLADLKALAIRALLEPEIARPNSICFYLGAEESPFFATAMSNIIRYDVEVTTTKHYKRWLQQRWRSLPGPRHNESDHWLSRSDLAGEVAEQLHERTAEDRKVFEVISAALDQPGAISIRGSQLAGLYGDTPVAEWPDRAVYTAPLVRGEAIPAHPVIVQGRTAIDAHLANEQAGPPVALLEFGANGSGMPYLREGWAEPEETFTWTADVESRFELPKPTRVGNYRIRLIGGPYVAEEHLATQRITLVANDIILGTAALQERAAIEFQLPRPVLGGRDTTAYRLLLPDAARPREVAAADDDRLLGFALERIELLLSGEEPADASNILLVEGKDAIGAHLVEPPPGSLALRLSFGLEVADKPLFKGGWAIPEEAFTWTTSRVSWLTTPAPVPVDDYVLRLIAGPFAKEDRWEAQRIRIAANDMALGETLVRERAVIECTLPRTALVENEPIVFRFAMPDAVRPCDVDGGEDDRLLGFAFESLELLRPQIRALDGSARASEQRDLRVTDAGTDETVFREQEIPASAPGPESTVVEPEVWQASDDPIEPGKPSSPAHEIDRSGAGSVEVSASEMRNDTREDVTGSRSLPEPEAGADLGLQDLAQPKDGEPVRSTAAANGSRQAEDRTADAIPPEELLMRFESLGQNCEFGLVQRRCGAEPLGLFRFASAPLPKLIAALKERFEGFGAADNIIVELSENGREYMINDRRFGLLYHAWVLAGEMSPEEIHAREFRRLPFLVRKLIEDLTSGDKIFVWHGMDDGLDRGEVQELLASMRRYGPATLLWVTLADAGHAAGRVERAGPGLLKAYIDRFAPGEDAHDFSLSCWIDICREAYRLRREEAETELAPPRPDATAADARTSHAAALVDQEPQTTSRAAAPPPPSELQEQAKPINELMMRFESLGEDCEFGLVQRRCGAEPLGLFRFASASLPSLLSAVEARFAGFGAADKIAVELSSNGREYMISDRLFGIRYHSWVLADEMRPEEVRDRESRRLPRLVAKLLQELTTGHKLLVVRGAEEPLDPESVRRLVSCLRSFGPNTLLWVELAGPQHPAGQVDWIEPHLLKGYIDRFAPAEDPYDLSLECWTTICLKAERLWQIDRVRDLPAQQVEPATAAE